MKFSYVFDLDGTLVDTEGAWVQATANYLAKKGHPVSEAFALKIVYGRSWFDVYASLVDAFPDLDIGLPIMEAEMANDFYAIRDTYDVRIPSSIALLRQLSKTSSCCIVSGSPREHITEAIAIMDVADCVSFYLGSEEYPRGKPDPSGFLIAADRLGVPPATCVVFEDSFVGVAAGQAAGMKTVALSRPGHPKQNVGAADLILADLADFNPELLMAP